MAPRNIHSNMRLLLWCALALLLVACANMGRPEGGPRDEMPPVYLHSDPAPGATGVTRTRLTAVFDENIQLEDAFSKVVVSPAQKTPPAVSANGRRLTVEFRDTLIPATTYTIDFGDAIKDLNEGNVLDGFAIEFSTGDSIDSLRISGMVLQAENLEPAQGMLVGVYSNLSDTALTTLPLDRIARTNQLGHFTIRGLKPVPYRIFAINDVNRDYHWDRSEDVAFYDTVVTPWVEHIEVTDTLFSSTGADSLVMRSGLRYMPNDILLSWFNTGYKAHYLADYKRPERRRITLNFAAAADSLPRITIASGVDSLIGADISEWALVRANPTCDTLEYWLADPRVIAADSLRLAVQYLKTDTADALVATTDTLRFFYRDFVDKKKKKAAEEAPTFRVDSVTGDTIPLLPPDTEFVTVRAVSASGQDINRPLLIETSIPLAALDTAGVHMELLVDTIWTPVPVSLRPDSSNLVLRSRIDMDWTPGAKYRLSVDSLAMTSVYGPWNKPFRHEFTVRQLEDYANLRVTMPGTDSLRVVVQLMSNDDPRYVAVKPEGTTVVDLRYINPGTYYMRAFVDTTPDGVWTTGDPATGRQPEDVYYFAKKLDLKKNWDVEQTWIMDELPVDAQKPYAIKKNRPKLKRGEQAPDQNEDEDDGMYDDQYNPFDKTGRGNRNGRTGSGNTNRPAGIRPAY